MNKPTLRNKIRYWFDCTMSRGPVAMSMLLLAMTVLNVVLIGIFAWFFAEEGGMVYQMWNSLMHMLDAGTLAGNDTGNIPYVFLMSMATLCGMVITSILIGIISAGVESKLRDLRKGTSVVLEEDHTLIIGFNDNIYPLLTELIEANASRKDACIVILGQQEKEDMEDQLLARLSNLRSTRIICRSGSLHSGYSLKRCSAETSRSIIINVSEDAETVKILLALSAYLVDKELLYPDLRIVTTIQDSQFMEAANIAGEGRVDIIYARDAIARIISNTCRQHGLSQVLMEIFDFKGNEFYFESPEAISGKTFRKALMCFSNAIPVGIKSGDNVMLNPPMDTLIGLGDQIILLEEDNGAYNYHPARDVGKHGQDNGQRQAAQASDHLVVLGSNNMLPIILTEYDKYVKPNTPVLIVDDDLDLEGLGKFVNLQISVCTETICRSLLCRLLDDDKATNILLLNDSSKDPEESDARTLLRLILMRDIADSTGRHFSITTEMHNVDNQRLASQARVDDFVIGSNFASLMMAQIAENPGMMPLIQDLLDESGSELYMKQAGDYVPLGVSVDSYILTDSAASRGEIYLGYRKAGGKVVVNPEKTLPLVFEEGDQIVVIADN